jgi:hypothetical protein
VGGYDGGLMAGSGETARGGIKIFGGMRRIKTWTYVHMCFKCSLSFMLDRGRHMCAMYQRRSRMITIGECEQIQPSLLNFDLEIERDISPVQKNMT